jgi:hypothetical protein
VTLHLPVLKLGVLLPAQDRLEDKFGGMPWGFPRERWPKCRHCSAPQSFLAQLSHHSRRLNLGRKGRILLAFQCDSAETCPNYEGNAGANAVLFLESDELREGPTPAPHPEMAIYTEARVLRWKERSRLSNTETTLTGGKPHWFQNEEDPPPPWRFALQMQFSYYFKGRAPSADKLGCEVRRERSGKTVVEFPKATKVGAPFCVYADDKGWGVQTQLFGDSMIYVFVRTDGNASPGWMVTQAT